MIFDNALPNILEYEGGFVDDPDDHGGATNKGITQKVYDSFRRSHGLSEQSVKDIEDKEVSDIYHQNYWLDGRCDKLPGGVALIHFDASVMSGIGQAARTLQRVLGVEVDGRLGVLSIAAAHDQDQTKLIHDYSSARRAFYTRLSTNPGQSKFLKGWLARVDKCEQAAIDSI